MITIKSIWFKNIRSHVNETEINFSDGYTSVIGPNGSGKTTLSFVVPWVLLGARGIKDLKESDLIPFDSRKYPEGKIVMGDSSSTIEIYRSISGATMKVDNFIVASTKSEVATQLNNRYRINPSTVRSLIYIGQNELKDILDGDPERRLKTVESILGIDELRAAKELLARDVISAREEMDGTNVDLNEIGYTEAEIVEHTKQINGIKKQISSSESELKTAKTKREQAAVKSKKIGADLFRVQTSLRKVGQLSDKLTELSASLRSSKEVKSNLNDSVEYLKSQLDDTEKLVADSGTKAKEQSKAKAELDKRRDAHDEMVATIKIARSKLDDISNQIVLCEKPSDPEPTSKEVNKLNDRLSEVGMDVEHFLSEMQNAKRILIALENDEAVCSRCGSELSDSHKEFINKAHTNAKSRHASKSALLSKLLDEKSELDRLSAAWSTYKSRSEHNSTLREKEAVYQGELKKAEEGLGECRRLLDEATGRYESISKVVHEISLANSRLVHTKNKLSSERQQLKSKLTEIHSLSESISEIKKELSSYDRSSLEVSHSRLNDEHTSTKAKEETLSEAVRRLTQDVYDLSKDLAQRQKALRSLQSKIEQLNNDKHEYEEAKKTYDKLSSAKKLITMFRKDYQSRILPAITEYLNKLYAYLGDGEFKTIEITDTLDIFAVKNGHKLIKSNMSDAQQITLALCFRLALNRLKQVTTDTNLGILILDEPTASFDDSRIARLMELMNKLTNVVPQIICVTHSDIMKSVGGCITVSMDHSGVSHVV